MDIIDDVRQVIAKTLKRPVDEVKPDMRLEDLGASSLDTIEVVFELEEKFDISIPMEAGAGAARNPGGGPLELDTMTIAEVSNAIKKLVDAKASA